MYSEISSTGSSVNDSCPLLSITPAISFPFLFATAKYRDHREYLVGGFTTDGPVALKRSAVAKLRLLPKNRLENRVLIGESGAVPALILLLRCADPWTQEDAVIALLIVSLLGENRALIAGTCDLMFKGESTCGQQDAVTISFVNIVFMFLVRYVHKSQNRSIDMNSFQLS
ncbi:hypothetical protein L2E82_02022 [Cichorium intybus]|uniref:Uncharacterized protein n=1 Tax=Cichorium intybus TaxID=13427 RepID=A0ACB9H162_CICIN|nr:hypothetical protein L2E82_02022 [Cichorium intybus]